MQRKLNLFLAVSLFVTITRGQCQVLLEKPNYLSAFQEYAVGHLQEKIFIHTDKDFYFNKDLLFLKLYLVDGTFHKPIDLSKLAYVELIDKNDYPVLQTTIPINDGTGHASLDLSTVPSGQFVLRAYTRWMRNQSPEFFFQKNIEVFDVKRPASVSGSTASKTKLDVQFFPEGGQMVYGLKSKVAFKVVDGQGKGVSVSGVVLNQRNDTVTQFRSHIFGMGHFLFTPRKDDHYRVELKAGTDMLSVELPLIASEGYVLSANTNPRRDSVDINITYTGPSIVRELFLLVHTRQFIKIAVPVAFSNNLARYRIPMNKLAEGITHLTIFDNDGKPVCERLLYKCPTETTIQATPSKFRFNTREQVTVSISQMNESLGLTNASVSVFLTDSLQTSYTRSIVSYLYLQSDLKGYIENADYYLNPTPEALEAADNLMLTQGWTRFAWDDVFASKKKEINYAPEYEGQILSGTAFKNGASSLKLSLIASRPGKPPQIFATNTDKDGKFEFYLKPSFGEQNLAINPIGLVENVVFSLEQPYDTAGSTSQGLSHTNLNNARQTLTDRAMYAQLTQDRRAKDKSEGFPNSLDSISFFGKPDKSYLLDEYTRFNTIEDIFREYVPEVIVRRQNSALQLFVLNENTETFFKSDPLVLVDGVPISNFERLLKTTTKPLKTIDVVTKRFFHGPLVFDGIVSFTTYKHDLADFQLDPSTAIFLLKGAAEAREFYSPLYGGDAPNLAFLPDFRSVLHWLPNMKLTPGQPFNASFYTGDLSGTFMGLIQGISANGIPVFKTFSFEVRDSPN